MQIITYAGVAKSCYMEALAAAKRGDFETASAAAQKGDESFVEAHHGHGALLQEEMETEEPRISLLMCHAEDQLTGAETLKTIILELIELYKEKRG